RDEAGRPRVRFVITDTGPGIPHHLLATLFEPFAKTEETYAARHAGTGVGLAVAKRLIESIGGTIGVESEPGMGASFWITVPAIQRAEMPDKAPEPVAPPRDLALLVYLPDETMLASMEGLLAPFGNALTVATTLAQAVTISARGGFSLILAGAGTVGAFAATPGQCTPILALLTDEEHEPDGANGMLRWPATPDALYAAITAMTGQRAKSAEVSSEDRL